jgi:hypothetical protein
MWSGLVGKTLAGIFARLGMRALIAFSRARVTSGNGRCAIPESDRP